MAVGRAPPLQKARVMGTGLLQRVKEAALEAALLGKGQQERQQAALGLGFEAALPLERGLAVVAGRRGRRVGATLAVGRGSGSPSH